MIYFVQDESSLNIKIGFHGGEDAMSRIKSLQTGCPSQLVLLATREGRQEDEQALHKRFAAARIQGEWFRPIPTLIRLIISCVSVDLARESLLRAADDVMVKKTAIFDPDPETILTELHIRTGVSITVRRDERGKKYLHPSLMELLTESDHALLNRNKDSIIAWFSQ